MAINAVVAENTAVRTSGFLSWGLNPHNWGVQPNFYTSFVNNSVLVGNAWGGQTGGFAAVSASDQGNITLNRVRMAFLRCALSAPPARQRACSPLPPSPSLPSFTLRGSSLGAMPALIMPP